MVPRFSSSFLPILVLSMPIADRGWHCNKNIAGAFAFPKIPNQLHPRKDRRRRTLPTLEKDEQPTTTSPPPLSFPISTVSTELDGNNSNLTQGRLLLGFVALLYGSLNVALRFVYEIPEIPPTAAALSATRGWLACLCFVPLLAAFGDDQDLESFQNNQTQSVSLLRAALELALWGFLAQGLLNIGLVSTGSARASFLTQTSVLFTPLISTLIGKECVNKSTWYACGVALIGLGVLTMGAGAGATTSMLSLSFSQGDLFVMGGALSWSMYLFRISSLGQHHPDLILQGVKTFLMAIFYSIWWMASSAATAGAAGFVIPSWMASGPLVWIALLYSAVGPGTIADVLQQKGQTSGVSPSEANILLSAEPVFATIFAMLLLGESSSLLELTGGGLIGLAAVVASL